MRERLAQAVNAVILLSLLGCGDKDSGPAEGGAKDSVPASMYTKQIRQLASADAAADAEKAVTAGDFRFVGVMGVGLAVPGVPDYHEKYAARYGCRVIPGTSDAIESEEHMQLQQVARDYAEKYNQTLRVKIESRKRR